MPIQAHMTLGLAVGLQDDGAGTLMPALVGIGWTVREPTPEPMAVSAIIYVPRNEAGPHNWRLELTYVGGEPVTLDAAVPGVPENFVYESTEDMVGLDDPALTTPLTMGFAVGLPPFPLPEGREYLWRLTVDGETRDEWVLPFRTTPPAPLA